MSNSTQTQDAAHLTTVRSILWHAIDYGVTTRKALALSADSSEEMVGRVLAGQAPKLMVFRRWVGEASPLPKSLKDQLMGWFHRTTAYAAVGRGVGAGDELLDHNGDGLVDARDVLGIKIDAAAKGAEAMAALSEAMLDGELNESERGKVRGLLHDMATLIDRATEALDHPGNGKSGGPSIRVA
jgi:hypothetical protein